MVVMEMKVTVCDACRSEMDKHSEKAWGSLSVSARTESGGYAYLDYCSLACARQHLAQIETLEDA